MKITLDKDVDVAYVYFKEILPGEVAKTICLNDSINIDLDSEEQILGIEILNANENLPSSTLESAEIIS
jgi:uncharacterized protein YuzE